MNCAKQRILYVTDLDGTLLDEAGAVTPSTVETLKRLAAHGVLLTCATARSWTSTHRLVGDLFRPPVIVHNGAATVDPVTGVFLNSRFLHPARVNTTIDICRELSLSPMVHAVEGNREVAAWVATESNDYIRGFWSDRPGDKRASPRTTHSHLPRTNVLGVTLIASLNDMHRVSTAFESRPDMTNVSIRHDTYRSGTGWLEIVAPEVSKGNAIVALAARLSVNRIVVFGDDVNDISMFEIANESYAVSGAIQELQLRATATIGANTDEAVARWLDEHGAVEHIP